MEHLTEAPWPENLNQSLNRLYYARSASKIVAPFVRDLKDLTESEIGQIVGEMLMTNFGEKWEKDYAAHALKYDPITNYDRHEEHDQVRTPELKRQITDAPPETTEETNKTEAGHKIKTDDTPAIVSEMRQETQASYKKQIDTTPAGYTDNEEYNGYKEETVEPGKNEHEEKTPAGYTDQETYNNYLETETPPGETSKEIPGVHVGQNNTKTTTGSDENKTVNDSLQNLRSIQGFNGASMAPSEQDVTTGGQTETRTPNLTEEDTEETHLDALNNPHIQAESGANITIKTGQQGTKSIQGGKSDVRTYQGQDVTDLTVTPITPGSKTIEGGKSNIRTYQGNESQVETYDPQKPAVIDITPTLESAGVKNEEYTPTSPEKSTVIRTTQKPGDRVENESGTDTIHEVIDAKGNIGVTTSQQMLQSEYDLNATYIFFEGVMADIDKLLTIGTFRRHERPRRRFW